MDKHIPISEEEFLNLAIKEIVNLDVSSDITSKDKLTLFLSGYILAQRHFLELQNANRNDLKEYIRKAYNGAK